jgi:hypothetical protein
MSTQFKICLHTSKQQKRTIKKNSPHHQPWGDGTTGTR